MFVEFRMQATMKFIQQTMITNGSNKIVGVTSTQLKSKIKQGFDNQNATIDGTTIPVFRLIDSSYHISYSSVRTINPFLTEKDMIIIGEFIVRHRRALSTSLPHRAGGFNSTTQSKLCIKILHDIVSECGGQDYGDVNVYSYMPIDPTDYTSYTAELRNNNSDVVREFFKGKDIPSTVFAGISSFNFFTTKQPQIRVTSGIRLSNDLRVCHGGVLHDPIRRGLTFVRIALGLTPTRHDISHFSLQHVNETTEIRIIDGPTTEMVCERERQASNGRVEDRHNDSDEYYEEEDDEEDLEHRDDTDDGYFD